MLSIVPNQEKTIQQLSFNLENIFTKVRKDIYFKHCIFRIKFNSYYKGKHPYSLRIIGIPISRNSCRTRNILHSNQRIKRLLFQSNDRDLYNLPIRLFSRKIKYNKLLPFKGKSL